MESHDYYARINGKDYPITWGFQITEEMGETLDSGSITIPHLFEIISLKPYDDVIIHDYLPNVDPEEGGLPNRPLGKVFSAGEGHFYKHMVVASYTREKVNLADERGMTDDDGKKYFSRVYNYKIQLKSETCKLETAQLPNKTISQPMSVAEKSGQEPLSANFRFGGETRKYTLPYGIENSSAGRSFRILENVVEATGQTPFSEYTVMHAYISNENPAMADYSSFLTMRGSVSLGEAVVLPDWAISGVMTAVERYNEGAITKHRYYDDWDKAIAHHPKKHWIVRKLSGKSNKGWESKDVIVARIKAYLAGAADSEIVNDKLTGKEGSPIGADITDASGSVTGRDISSSEPINSISAIFPSEEASYVIYMYCDPEIVKVYSDKHQANLYGTTDNSNGATRPTKDSEFLCSWGTESEPFSVASATSSLSKGALSAYEAMRQAVELYSPYLKSKESADSDKWTYRRKFSIGDDVKAIFSSVTAPENQWNCPNLRDFLTRIMYVKDCIPIVHDNVINCMSLSKRGVIPFDDSNGLFGIENYAMDGNSYCDRLIRTYSDGLSKDNVVKCVERVGFRNSGSATLTLDGLRLELAHPIYKITKVMMCHYNKMSVKKSGEADASSYYGVIKHDITPLVVLNSQRNLLSEDWASLNAEAPKSIKELAKYKYATIGYDIGSRYLSGWGAKYTYPSCFFWSGSKTVIENIFTFAYGLNPYGSNAFALYSELAKLAGDGGDYDAGAEVFSTGAENERKALHSEGYSDDGGDVEWASETASDLKTIDLGQYSYGGVFTNLTERMKTLFFIVEYEGYVSASVMSSKDFHDGDVVSRDNASSSLSFVESDGANQKEKVNRLGNAIVTQPVRYSSREDIEELGQVWDGYSLSDEERESGGDVDLSGRAKEHDDEVLYQRKMAFERDFVQASYTFCRNYVLRNYFTSVFAKRRPFALASYEESVERQENKTLQLRFSPDSAYYQSAATSKVMNYSEGTLIPAILSFYKATGYGEDGEKVILEGIDSSYYMVFPSENFSYDGQCGAFATDCQKFTSGNSACFAVSMTDNVSAGVFVSDWNPTLGSYLGNLLMSRWKLLTTWRNGYNLSDDDVKATDLLTGSKQDWLMFPVDPDTGELYSMRFGVGFKRNDFYAIDSPKDIKPTDTVSWQLLPLMDAVVISADGSEATYFGESEEIGDKTYCIGFGYPRISFKLNSDLYPDNASAYKADLSNAGSFFDHSKIVSVWDAEYYSAGNVTFLTVDGSESLGTSRQEIRELMSAKFVGRETEDSDETDTCVFKDGKERISVTMQVEPVSEDNRVLFSDMMMKLSDAMGGYEKNYAEVTLEKAIKAIVGVSHRRFEYNAKTSGHLHMDWKFRGVASIPSVSILVPSGSSLEATSIGKTFLWSGSDAFYSITIKTINGFDSEGNLLATCTIEASDSSSLTETVTFVKTDDSADYITGRTGASTFAKEWTLFESSVQSGYDSYSMVEDAFFKYKRIMSITGEVEYNAVFNDSAYVNRTDAGFIGGNSAGSGLSYSSSEGSLLAVGTDVFPELPLTILDKSISVITVNMSHTVVSTDTTTDKTWGAVSSSSQQKEPVYLAGVSDASAQKARNMFWVKAPIMGSRETSWDVRGSVYDSEFDVIEGIGDVKEVSETKTFSVVVRNLGMRTQWNGSIPLSDFISGNFPDEAYGGFSITCSVSGFSDPEAIIMAVDCGDMSSDGSIPIIGYSTLKPLRAAEETIEVTLAYSASGTKLIPVAAEDDGRGLWRLKIALDEPLAGDRSLRLYYKDGAEYRFAFGANLGAKADKGKSDDVIYPSNEDGNVYYVYVTALDDRSRTVMDAETGDPSYKVADWLDESMEDEVTPYNKCVKKSQ